MNANHRVETLDSILERLRSSIKKNGLKNSKQREEIIAVLYKSGTHLSQKKLQTSLKLQIKMQVSHLCIES